MNKEEPHNPKIKANESEKKTNESEEQEMTKTKQLKETKEENEIESLRRQFNESNKLAEERLNQLKYLHADFDNYRKKFDRERDQIIKLANENLIKELIVLLDDMDSAIKICHEHENKEGLMKLKKKLYDILQNYGLKEIEAMGTQFNPELHEVLCKESSEQKDDEVIEEIQKGYTLKSKVIRPSKVKVSKSNQQNLKITKTKN